jgi:hypothetical protein
MWLAPAFLLGLLAIGWPLWLHRFARQTQERRQFPSLMLIEPGEVRRSRRQQLRYLLLLALRVALLAALALAFAGPLWPRKPGAAASGVARLHLIVVDTSLSMNAAGVWPRAVERAASVIDTLRGGDRGMLVAADNRLRVLQRAVYARDAERLRAALHGLSAGRARLDYGGVMTSAAALASGSDLPVVLHLITDLQQSASPARFVDLQPPAGVDIDLIDVGSESLRTVRVGTVALAQQNAGAIEVSLGGDLPAGAARELRLEIDGVERGRRRLDEKRAVPYAESFSVGDLGEGEHRIVASLSASPTDDLRDDDTGYTVLRRVEPRVLVVTVATTADDASYLRAALGAMDSPRLRTETVDAAGLERRALNDYAAVVVSDAGLLSPAAAQTLRRFVAGGGALLMTLGQRALQQRSVPVAGGRIVQRKLAAAGALPARVAQVEQSHPILRDAGDWRALRFFRHVAVETGKDQRVLLRLDDGDPLLLEQQLGRGRLMLLTSGLDRSWNDLAIEPQFVRFIAEVAVYLSGGRVGAEAVTAGEVINLGGRAGAQVFAPDGRRALMLEATSGELRLVPEQSGFYEVRGGGRSRWIAVNTDPRESQLLRMTPQRLVEWRALSAPAAAGTPGTHLQGANATVRGAGTAAAGGGWVDLWFWCLLAAAVLALAEAVVANYHLVVKREQV